MLFARVRVEKISAGYAHERGPIQALKKKLKTQVLQKMNVRMREAPVRKIGVLFTLLERKELYN